MLLKILLLSVLTIGNTCFAGSTNEVLFNRDMQKILPLIPAGWELAKSYMEDSFTIIDEKIDILSDSYTTFKINTNTAYVFMEEETPTFQRVPELSPSMLPGKRKVVIA